MANCSMTFAVRRARMAPRDAGRIHYSTIAPISHNPLAGISIPAQYMEAENGYVWISKAGLEALEK